MIFRRHVYRVAEVEDEFVYVVIEKNWKTFTAMYSG